MLAKRSGMTDLFELDLAGGRCFGLQLKQAPAISRNLPQVRENATSLRPISLPCSWQEQLTTLVMCVFRLRTLTAACLLELELVGLLRLIRALATG